MGFIKAVITSLKGTLQDQYKQIITVNPFSKYDVVLPGTPLSEQGRYSLFRKTMSGAIPTGSMIFVPENTAAVILSHSGIEQVLTGSGGYTYNDGTPSLANQDKPDQAILGQFKERFSYGGYSPAGKALVYVNLREIEQIAFKTKKPLIYHDPAYDVNLELEASGSFSLQVIDPSTFLKNFVPANVTSCSFADPELQGRLLPDLQEAFIVALTHSTENISPSKLSSKASSIAQAMMHEIRKNRDWDTRFGIRLTDIAVDAVSFTKDSRKLIREVSKRHMLVKVFDGVTEQAVELALSFQAAEKIGKRGFHGIAPLFHPPKPRRGITPPPMPRPPFPVSEESSLMQNLQTLLEAGLLTQEEYSQKKKELLQRD